MKYSECGSLKTGFYSATNEDGKNVFIGRQEGHGWQISVPTHDGWYENIFYDEDGNVEAVTYGK